MMKNSTLLLAFILSTNALLAAHLPGGNITYICTGANQYEVTLTLFRDCDGADLLPQDLHFMSDCGTSFTIEALPISAGTEVSQLCPTDLPNSSCSGGDLTGIEVYQVNTTVPLGPCNSWRISWQECCRSGSVNLTGTPGTYIEARLNSVTAPCNNSPVFTQDVIPYVCLNEPVSYNLAVTEPDGHDLRYRLISARQLQPPTPVNYANGNSGGAPYPGLEIDSLSGQITFTPMDMGMIFVVVRVDEYLGNGLLAGTVMRDFPFVVISCPNTAPDLNGGQLEQVSGQTIEVDDMGISLCTYGNFCFDITISDQDVGQTVSLNSNVATVLPGATFTTTGTNPVTATICWEGGDLNAGNYGFVVSAEDDACPTTGLTTYAYSITVLADSVSDCLGTNISVVLDPVTGFSVWPNPANAQLYVEHDSNRIAEYWMYDLQGRLIHTGQFAPGRSVLDTSGDQPGTYLLHLRSNGRDDYRKVILSLD